MWATRQAFAAFQRRLASLHAKSTFECTVLGRVCCTLPSDRHARSANVMGVSVHKKTAVQETQHGAFCTPYTVLPRGPGIVRRYQCLRCEAHVIQLDMISRFVISRAILRFASSASVSAPPRPVQLPTGRKAPSPFTADKGQIHLTLASYKMTGPASDSVAGEEGQKRGRENAALGLDDVPTSRDAEQAPTPTNKKRKSAKQSKGPTMPSEPVGTRYEESMRPERMTSKGYTLMSWNVAGASEGYLRPTEQA